MSFVFSWQQVSKQAKMQKRAILLSFTFSKTRCNFLLRKREEIWFFLLLKKIQEGITISSSFFPNKKESCLTHFFQRKKNGGRFFFSWKMEKWWSKMASWMDNVRNFIPSFHSFVHEYDFFLWIENLERGFLLWIWRHKMVVEIFLNVANKNIKSIDGFSFILKIPFHDIYRIFNKSLHCIMTTRDFEFGYVLHQVLSILWFLILTRIQMSNDILYIVKRKRSLILWMKILVLLIYSNIIRSLSPDTLSGPTYFALLSLWWSCCWLFCKAMQTLLWIGFGRRRK